MLEISARDQVLTASADTPLLAIYAALPATLYPPFPPVELPGGVGGLISRGGFAQTFFFGAEVLGLTFVSPSGRRIVAGGRTVKNVQGYDLTRPFVGSFGALGQAETVTLRLRPGLAFGHHARSGTLASLDPARPPRFAWQHGGTLHAVHFGHAREVASVMATFGGEPVTERPDYSPLFAAGLGVGPADAAGASLRDPRLERLDLCWQDGGAVPAVPALFARVAAAL
jgi:glycolate oxidase FAD binding subunit